MLIKRSNGSIWKSQLDRWRRSHLKKGFKPHRSIFHQNCEECEEERANQTVVDVWRGGDQEPRERINKRSSPVVPVVADFKTRWSFRPESRSRRRIRVGDGNQSCIRRRTTMMWRKAEERAR